MIPNKQCPVCGKEFYVSPSNIRPVNYCSKHCVNELRRKHPKKTGVTIPTLCACGCGQFFNRSESKNRRYVSGHGRSPLELHSGQTTTKCGTCNKDFTVSKRRLEKFNAVYCSRGCAAIGTHTKHLHDFICEQCGKEFRINKSRKAGNKVFCTLKCCNEYRRAHPTRKPVFVKCSGCQIDMEVFPSKAKLNKHFYCSLECRKKHIIGKNNPSYVHGLGRHIYYGLNWKSQRRLALKRDNHQCQICGKTPNKGKRLHVHHITPAHTFNKREDANVLTNLLTLCWLCHKKAEKGIIPVQRKLL